jgi:dTDP-glucose 4,6-dehydratase
MKMKKSMLITGGAGFIGSNFINYFVKKYQTQANSKNNDNAKYKNYAKYNIINLDKLTYAGNIDNLKNVSADENYHFIQGDINDKNLVSKILQDYNTNIIVNFAAESHVDNSIANPNIFVETNVLGTANLLSCAKEFWQKDNFENKLFIQISTDEVYGSLSEFDVDIKFTEKTPLSPHSPYAASKAGADLLVQSYFDTYKFPTVITRCSNNYGAKQYPEKLIPLMIKNALQNKKLPVYGDGKNVRDWIFVEDHCEAITRIIEDGKIGEVYNIGANCEKQNIEIVKLILDYLDKPYSLIEYVDDRLGHDRRYAVDASKIANSLGWKPQNNFDICLKNTIDWYANSEE